ncbi:MAG: TMEM175 family protein [Methanobacteriaceae archaeon]
MLRDKNRLENFVDAVFAIAITILVLDLAVPILKDSNDVLIGFLINIWPKFLAYFLAFFVLASLLNNHHRQFRNIKFADQKIWWINMAFLAFIVLVPFSTSLISEYDTNLIAIVTFNVNLLIAGLLLYLNWFRVVKSNYILKESTTFQTIVIIKYINLAVPLATLLAIILAFINPRASILGFLVIIIFYLFSKRIFYALNSNRD